MRDFIDREEELGFLESQAASSRAELVVLYGRRRVGKTELLRRFCAGRPHVFFVAARSTSEQLLRDFARCLSEVPDSPLPPGTVPDSWPSAFQLLALLGRDRRFLVVLDEFPYLLEADPAIPSYLQNLWDTTLRRTRLMLVLCGSSVSVMESEVLGQASPLYGRRTAQWHLRPLSYRDAAAFFPRYSPEDRLKAYGVLGGMPAYLEQFDPDRSLADNVVDRVLRRGAMLYEEAYFLLQAELREAARYHAALTALGGGATRHHEVARAIFGPQTPGSAQPYLHRLEVLGLVERVVPVTVKDPRRTREAVYRIADPFVRFWFRFAVPHRSALEQGRAREVWEQGILPALAEYMGRVLEEVARQHVWELARAGRLGFQPDAVGSWWDGREELDVVAVRHATREAYVAECTWRGGTLHVRELDELLRKAAYFHTRSGYKVRTAALYSRGGFSPALRREAGRRGVLLYSVRDLYREPP